MAKAPAFQFYTGDWRKDTQLQMSSMRTRGVWIEMLICMWDAPQRGMLQGRTLELSRMLSCELDILDTAIEELDRLKIANVTKRHNEVTIINRRMFREAKAKENARLRKKAQRSRDGSHKDVTPPSSTSTSSSHITLSDFALFWEVFPKQMNEGQAHKMWAQLIKEGLFPENVGIILNAIAKQKRSDKWTRDGGKFIPNPSTWLEAWGWKDVVEDRNGSSRKPDDSWKKNYEKWQEEAT